jgi:drug/metabolite transporter (DMT)-like permease
MSSKEIMWSVFAGFIGIVGSVSLIAVIQLDEITFIMPNIQPIVILIGAILGYYVFNESMGVYKMIGIILIILGAFCVNYDKLKNSSTTKKVK